MKQFQFNYQGTQNLKKELQKMKQWLKFRITSGVIFQIFSESLNRECIEGAIGIIRAEFPKALYMGCSSSGNILDGSVSESDMIIVCTVCEFPSTKTEILQYTLTAETDKTVTQDLIKQLETRPWVKGIELLVTIRGMSMTGFCEALQTIRPEITIFGGGAFSADIDNNAACVFSSSGEYSEKGVVFLLIGGDDLHITTTHVTGWKPLGRTFHVTRAEGSTLYELDGKPAYDVYYKYLNIKNNEHFFANTLEFPFFYEHGGINILRAPIASNADGSLVMTSDIEENVIARLAYGDPWTILESIHASGQEISKFQPEIIHIFSCAARRTFWGTNEVGRETQPFQMIAPTSGFYTSGEFLRTNGYMNQHNVTLVIAAMREGSYDSHKKTDFDVEIGDHSGKISMINRLATFIEASTRELEEANAQLAFMVVSDGLTKLYNRTEIQRRIGERLKSGKPLSLIMIDIDNFKRVNDTYGHKEGDNVIIGLSDLFRNNIPEHNPDASAGRWGGEEFMLLFPYDLEYAKLAAEDIRKDFADIQFPAAGHQTISLGVTAAIPGEKLDALLIRVDKALYQAKSNGKNQFVIL